MLALIVNKRIQFITAVLFFVRDEKNSLITKRVHLPERFPTNFKRRKKGRVAYNSTAVEKM